MTASPKMSLRALPGGARLAGCIERAHPADRGVRAVLDWIEAAAADGDHALDLAAAAADETSLLTVDVRSKIQKLIDGDCLLDLIEPPVRRSSVRRAFACVRKP